VERAAHIVRSVWFNNTITAIIILNAIVIGLDTSATLAAAFHEWFTIANQLFLIVFIVEAVLKIAAEYPNTRRYFNDGWNIFDLSIIIISLIPATGQLATLARLARLLRVLRLISALPELRLVITTLIRSIPSMGHVIGLMSIVFYVYGVAGYHLFHDVDPTHWRNLGISLLSLFRIVTLEDWTDIMYETQEVYGFSWIYYMTFIFLTAFAFLNMVIGIVINVMEQVFFLFIGCQCIDHETICFRVYIFHSRLE